MSFHQSRDHEELREIADRLRQLRAEFGQLQDLVGQIAQNQAMGGALPFSPSVNDLLGPGVTTSASTAASGTTPNITPGLVNVTLSQFDGTHLATTGTALTGVYSNYTTIIPTGKPCWVYIWSGVYWILVADC